MVFAMSWYNKPNNKVSISIEQPNLIKNIMSYYNIKSYVNYKIFFKNIDLYRIKLLYSYFTKNH